MKLIIFLAATPVNSSDWASRDWISIIAQVLVFAAFIFAVVKYSSEKKREFQKRFFEEQFRAYSEAVDYAASITLYDKNDDNYKEAVKNFKRLYYGKMCLVENVQVESKMYDLNTLIDEYNEETDAMTSKGLNISIQNAAIYLAHACRESSLHTWGIDKLDGFNDYNLKDKKINN